MFMSNLSCSSSQKLYYVTTTKVKLHKHLQVTLMMSLP